MRAQGSCPAGTPAGCPERGCIQGEARMRRGAWLLGMCIGCLGQPTSGLPNLHKSRSCSCPEECSTADRVEKPMAIYSSL